MRLLWLWPLFLPCLKLPGPRGLETTVSFVGLVLATRRSQPLQWERLVFGDLFLNKRSFLKEPFSFFF